MTAGVYSARHQPQTRQCRIPRTPRARARARARHNRPNCPLRLRCQLPGPGGNRFRLSVALQRPGPAAAQPTVALHRRSGQLPHNHHKQPTHHNRTFLFFGATIQHLTLDSAACCSNRSQRHERTPSLPLWHASYAWSITAGGETSIARCFGVADLCRDLLSDLQTKATANHCVDRHLPLTATRCSLTTPVQFFDRPG